MYGAERSTYIPLYNNINLHGLNADPRAGRAIGIAKNMLPDEAQAQQQDSERIRS